MSDSQILFFDLEVIPHGPDAGKVTSWACRLNGLNHQGHDIRGLFSPFEQARYICAHHLFGHDRHYLPTNWFSKLDSPRLLDSLYFSCLMFPEQTTHALNKTYQRSTIHPNEPQQDVQLLIDLFERCGDKWKSLPEKIRLIYRSLLLDCPETDGLIHYLGADPRLSSYSELWEWIQIVFEQTICQSIANPVVLLRQYPLECAYALALIYANQDALRVPEWLMRQHPQIQVILHSLRGKPCLSEDCHWCQQHWKPEHALKEYFGFESFRQYQGQDLQAQMIRAALQGESMLAILPTGGGKSLSFQLPALMQGQALQCLSVVISPLLSLMKDQIHGLQYHYDIHNAVTLNSSQTQAERKLAIEAIRSGKASLLYISPEALRSNTVLRLLKERILARFIIDEAHCFSEWGQNFRVDYLYLARYLNELQTLKGLSSPIPVSCFTATAKLAVQQDILTYFKQRMGLDLALFRDQSQRPNLHFRVIKAEAEQKYSKLRLLLAQAQGPKIIYAATTRKVEEITQQLQREGFSAQPFHGQMETDLKFKHMDAFLDNQIEIIVATSAFGMGINKDNVCMVIHYDVPASLEDYFQEAGRAGRNPTLEADCVLLFDQADLDWHFQFLNDQRLNQKEINQIWAVLKKYKLRSFHRSSLEIARDAGWDTEDPQLETHVKTALAALEEAGLITRDQNDTLLLAGYFASCSVQQAQQIISASPLFDPLKIQSAMRMFQYLISRLAIGESTDLRFDWMCEHLGFETDYAQEILNALLQAGLVQHQQLQSLNLMTGIKGKNSRARYQRLAALERQLVKLFDYSELGSLPATLPFSLIETNNVFKQEGLASSIDDLKRILNHAWGKPFVSRQRYNKRKQEYLVSFYRPYIEWTQQVEQRLDHMGSILDFLERQKSDEGLAIVPNQRRVSFELKQLVNELNGQLTMTEPLSLHNCEKLLLHMHQMQIIGLENGVALYYTRLRINVAEDTSRRQYTKEHYQNLKRFYQHQIQQVHMIGNYASLMLSHTDQAQSFVQDYFQMEFKDLLRNYFKKHTERESLDRPMTAERWQRIFGELSAQQLEIIQDANHQRILVAAGPGSGKTRILVHKVAALLLMEEVKPEQFLMLTFSRPAAQEVRSRLLDLIGPITWKLDIATFHSFAFQLLEQPGKPEYLSDVIERATVAMQSDELPQPGRIESKSVILVDEYQDISEKEYAFLKEILKMAEASEAARVLVVGDDDQNIYEFRGSSTRFMKEFAHDFGSHTYYLNTNYRSRSNLVSLSNQFISVLPDRIKTSVKLQAADLLDGQIHLSHYAGSDFYHPLVDALKTQYSKRQEGRSVAVLCATNEEALILESLLRQAGLAARLLMQLDHFQLRHLLELKHFQHYLEEKADSIHGLISPGDWANCQQQVHRLNQGSQALEIFDRVVDDFVRNHEALYMSDWETSLNELRWEDVYDREQKGVILVSTMHKAKGKEFDDVWLYLDHCKLESEADRRVLYVAMTRARQNLMIHTRHNWFAHNIEDQTDYQQAYLAPNQLFQQLSLKDINLSFAKDQQKPLLKCVAGLQLTLYAAQYLQEPHSQAKIWLSQSAKQRWNKLNQQGFQPVAAEIGYLVVWFDRQDQKHYRIALPRIDWRRAGVGG